MAYAPRPDTAGSGTWGASAVGTTAGVTATHNLTTGANNSVCTGIQGSSDAAALVTIESPAGTVIWRKRFTAAFTFSEGFVALPGAAKQNILVKISASTANCEANIQGYDV